MDTKGRMDIRVPAALAESVWSILEAESRVFTGKKALWSSLIKLKERTQENLKGLLLLTYVLRFFPPKTQDECCRSDKN